MSGQKAQSVYVPLGGQLRNGRVINQKQERQDAPSFVSSRQNIKKQEKIGSQEPQEQQLADLFESARRENLNRINAQQGQFNARGPIPGPGIMMRPGMANRFDPRMMRGFR